MNLYVQRVQARSARMTSTFALLPEPVVRRATMRPAWDTMSANCDPYRCTMPQASRGSSAPAGRCKVYNNACLEIL